MNPAPLHERIRIASPCPMKWSEMSGDDRVRRCAACKLNVYNSAAMTTREIEQLLCASDRTCMRIYRRADGTLVTGDCSRLWLQRRDAARSLLSEGMNVLGLVIVLLIIAGITITLFGDNIRRLLGASTTGALVGPTLPPAPTKKKALTSFGVGHHSATGASSGY